MTEGPYTYKVEPPGPDGMEHTVVWPDGKHRLWFETRGLATAFMVDMNAAYAAGRASAVKVVEAARALMSEDEPGRWRDLRVALGKYDKEAGND